MHNLYTQIGCLYAHKRKNEKEPVRPKKKIKKISANLGSLSTVESCFALDEISKNPNVVCARKVVHWRWIGGLEMMGIVGFYGIRVFNNGVGMGQGRSGSQS